MLALLTAGSWIGVQLSVSEITPPERLALGGYTERRGALFERGGDRLHVRTLVLEGGGKKVVIASVEMLTIPESLHREVLAKLSQPTHASAGGLHSWEDGGTGTNCRFPTPSPALPHRSGRGSTPTYASILPRMEAPESPLPRTRGRVREGARADVESKTSARTRTPSPALPHQSGGGSTPTYASILPRMEASGPL
ncbi:MAG: hypothetical protein K1X67_00515, partial [Fimbriimonadaceae bacterium]|nr:hypothetical protein [Fimbriimonadaceae bacterium]